MRPDPKVCRHDILNWGSGAFYLFCYNCGQSWVAHKSGEHGELAYEQGQRPNDDKLRIRPTE